MPIQIPPQYMLEALQTADYRAINLSSYEQFIGGVRYVSIETDSATVTQFTPSDMKSAWMIWVWNAGEAHFRAARFRSELIGTSVTYRQWFGMVPQLCGYRISEGPLEPGRAWPMGFTDFVNKAIGGWPNPYYDYASGIFNQQHPPDPIAAAAKALKISEEKLAAREAAIRQKEAFADVENLKAIAAEYERAANFKLAGQYLQKAEEVRRIIQAKLDREAQESKTRYSLSEPDPAIFDYMKKLADKELLRQAIKEMESETVKAKPRPARAKLDTPATGKRSIILDGDF